MTSRFLRLCLVLNLLAGTAAVAAERFYRPARYRWYLEKLDLQAGMRMSEPLCRIVADGTDFPALLKPELLLTGKPTATVTSGRIVIRAGVVGPVVTAMSFKMPPPWRLPYLPAGFYKLEIELDDAHGKPVAQPEACFNVLEDTLEPALRHTPPLPADLFTATAQDGKLRLTGLPAAGPGLKVHLIARASDGSKEFEQYLPVGTVTGGKAELPLPALHPGQFVKLEVALETPERRLDGTSIAYFRRGSYPAAKPDWKALAPPPAPLSEHFTVHENQSLMGRFEDNRRGLEKLAADFKSRGSDLLNVGFKWYQLEPVTGVYDWSEFDKYVEFLTRNRIRFGIIGGSAIFSSCPFDTWGEWLVEDSGECRTWRKLSFHSPASPKLRRAQQDLIRAIYERYGDNPYFSSWLFAGPGLDSGIFTDHFDRVTDYSPWARAGFTAFLRKRYGDNLAALNRAWKSDFKQWNDVMPPLPDRKQEVDISTPWVDFTAYKLKLYADATVDMADPVVRALDPKRKLSHYLVYTGPIEYLFPAMKKHGSHLNDGGGEAHQMVRLYALAANWHMRRQPESHYVPADKLPQLHDMFTNMLRYGLCDYDLGTVWNSRVNVHADVYPRNKNLQQTMTAWKQLVPIFRTLADTTGDAPPVGFIFSWDDMFYRTRAWRWYALPGEGMQRAAAAASLGNVPWLSGITPENVYDRQKLLICAADNRVFSPELIDKLVRFVKRGGNLVICDNAGEYTVGSDEKFLWRKKLEAPADLADNAPAQWKFGAGQVRHETAPIDGPRLIALLQRFGVKRNVTSSNPAVQGFLLHHGAKPVLVISAFNGFDRLRQLKNKSALTATIALPELDGRWSLQCLYPRSDRRELSAAQLRKGWLETIAPSGLIIYQLEQSK